MSVRLTDSLELAQAYLANALPGYRPFQEEFHSLCIPVELQVRGAFAGYAILRRSRHNQSYAVLDYAIEASAAGSGGVIFLQLLSFAKFHGLRAMVILVEPDSQNLAYLERLHPDEIDRSHAGMVSCIFYLRRAP